MGLFDDSFVDESSSLNAWFDSEWQPAVSGPTTPIDPATLACTTLCLAPYSGAPWTGTASAGTSGTNPLISSTAPSVGTAINGLNTADFNGSTQNFFATDDTNTCFGSTGWSFAGVFVVDTLAADSGTPYLNACLWTDTGVWLGLNVSSTATQVWQYLSDAATLKTAEAAALTTGAVTLVQARWTGSALEVRINNGAWVSTPCASIVASGSLGSVRVGSNYSAGAVIDGREGAYITAATSWSNATADGVGAYLQQFFATDFGFTIAGGSKSLSLAGVRGLSRVGLAVRTGANALALSGALTRGRPGLATIAPGSVNVAPMGVRAPARGGALSLSSAAIVALSTRGIRSTARLGSASVSTFTTIATSGISSDARIGAAAFTGIYTVSLSGARARAKAGLASTTTAATLALVGASADSRLGSPIAATFVTVATSGVPADARVGHGTVTTTNSIALLGVRGRSSPGSVTTVPGAVASSLMGIAADARIGPLVAVAGGGAPSALALSGIRSDALPGLVTLTTSATIAPRGVYVDARVGGEQATGLFTIALGGVRSRAAVGRATVTTVATMALVGAPSDSRVGSASLSTFYTLSLRGVGADGRLGSARFASVWSLALSGVRAEGNPGRGTFVPGPVTASLSGVRTDGNVGAVTAAITFNFTIALVGVRALPDFGWSRAYINGVAAVTLADHPLTSIRVIDAPLTVIRVIDEPITRIRVMSNTTNSYDIGDVAEFTFELRVGGVLTDPTTFSVAVSPPTGIDVTYVYGTDGALTRTATGVFKASIPCTEAGMWSVFAVGTGAAAGAEPGCFNVRARPT